MLKYLIKLIKCYFYLFYLWCYHLTVLLWGYLWGYLWCHHLMVHLMVHLTVYLWGYLLVLYV